TLLLRHNLDVMHIEKNICESIVGTLLNMKGKTEDNLKSHKDLKDMGIQKTLYLNDDEAICKARSFTLSKQEEHLFCKRTLDLRLPYGYSSNIANRVSFRP
ncbi:PREDICTED: transposon, partial [Prunus dulcis]